MGNQTSTFNSATGAGAGGAGGTGGTGGGSSSSGKLGSKMRGLIQNTGSLGLTKAELDERCRPSGLYPSCKWEDKAIRKLIGDGKIAPRLQGTEHRTTPTDRECPICFLQYRQLNILKCCSAHICTECYLQVRPQKAKTCPCPFCNHNKMTVTPALTMNAESMLLREEAEQRVIEAKIRQRREEQQQKQQQEGAQASETLSSLSAEAAREGNANEETSVRSSSVHSFGSSLQKDERIALLRARSSSLTERENAESIPEDVLRSSIAMTPEERRRLEDEMRAQHSHPLTLQYQAEAEERRIRNEQEYLRNNPTMPHVRGGNRPGSYRRSRGGERRNWNQIVDAFERGGHGEVNSLDDLVVLEAAMILSMEEETRRRRADNNNNAEGNGGDAAFDANQHASEGFPMIGSLLSGRQQQSARLSSGDATVQEIHHLAQSLTAGRRRSGRNSLLRVVPGSSSAAAAMDAGGFAMRGISEDDQLAMAIAASLQEHASSQERGEDGGETGSAVVEDGETSSEASNNNNNNNNDDDAGNAEIASADSRASGDTSENRHGYNIVDSTTENAVSLDAEETDSIRAGSETSNAVSLDAEETDSIRAGSETSNALPLDAEETDSIRAGSETSNALPLDAEETDSISETSARPAGEDTNNGSEALDEENHCSFSSLNG